MDKSEPDVIAGALERPSGVRYARNQVLMSIMRDYGYVEGLGMGIRRQVIPAMARHNGTEPEFLEEEHRFTVCLRK